MGNDIDPAFSHLLARLYAGIDSERPWQDFLETLARWMEATYATLIIAAPGTRLPGTFVTPGADPRHSADYVASFFADDPFQGLPEGKVTSFAQFAAGLPEGCFTAYREYLRIAGGEQVLAVDLRFGGRFEARFRVSRNASLQDFTPAERERLQGLVPHLRIAVQLFEKLQFAGAQHGVFHSAAEGLGLALLVLDRNRRIVSSNALAEQWLAEGEGVLRSGETIAFASPGDRHTIAALLAGKPDESDAIGEAVTRFRIGRPIHGDLIATARPLDLPAIHSGTGAVALFLVHPGGEAAPDPRDLRALLGLTPAEARLAGALAEGRALVEAARQLGIAHNTAKVQLRSIFAKTGVHRQAQLVALLATLNG